MKKHSDRGFTLIELLIVVAIISIIAAIAVPGLLRSRMTGNETSAITSLKAMTVGQVQYSTTCGNGGYATSLPVLFAAPGGVGEGYISPDLGQSATPIKSGYNFALVPGAGAGAGPTERRVVPGRCGRAYGALQCSGGRDPVAQPLLRNPAHGLAVERRPARSCFCRLSSFLDVVSWSHT